MRRCQGVGWIEKRHQVLLLTLGTRVNGASACPCPWLVSFERQPCAWNHHGTGPSFALHPHGPRTHHRVAQPSQGAESASRPARGRGNFLRLAVRAPEIHKFLRPGFAGQRSPERIQTRGLWTFTKSLNPGARLHSFGHLVAEPGALGCFACDNLLEFGLEPPKPKIRAELGACYLQTSNVPRRMQLEGLPLQYSKVFGLVPTFFAAHAASSGPPKATRARPLEWHPSECFACVSGLPVFCKSAPAGCDCFTTMDGENMGEQK